MMGVKNDSGADTGELRVGRSFPISPGLIPRCASTYHPGFFFLISFSNSAEYVRSSGTLQFTVCTNVHVYPAILTMFFASRRPHRFLSMRDSSKFISNPVVRIESEEPYERLWHKEDSHSIVIFANLWQFRQLSRLETGLIT